MREITERAGRFEVGLVDGERVRARNVVVAAGVEHFARLPEVLSDLPRQLCTHSSGHDERPATPHSKALIWAMLIALVLIATSGALVEDAGSTWAALYLSGSLGAVASVAALGFVALTGAQFVGRLIGDRLVDRFGQRAVARTGGLIVLTGMGLALAAPSVPGTIAGFAAAGFGVATLVPAAMHTADELPGLRHGTGLTLVSWLMRLGFLCSPPLVGLIADATSVRTGLLVVPIAGVLVILLASVLPSRPPATPAAKDTATNQPEFHPGWDSELLLQHHLREN